MNGNNDGSDDDNNDNDNDDEQRILIKGSYVSGLIFGFFLWLISLNSLSKPM